MWWQKPPVPCSIFTDVYPPYNSATRRVCRFKVLPRGTSVLKLTNMNVCVWVWTDPGWRQQPRVSLRRYSSHQRQLQDGHMQTCCCGVASDHRIGQPATHTVSTQQVQQELSEHTHTHTHTHRHTHTHTHSYSCCSCSYISSVYPCYCSSVDEGL